MSEKLSCVGVGCVKQRGARAFYEALRIVLLVPLLAIAPAFGQDTVEVLVDPGRATSWTVSKNIFGKFHEHNGRDAYPGIYAQHVANGSFEAWYASGRGHRTEVLFRDTESTEGLAYPWEPIGDAAWEPREGGVNGKRYQRIRLAAFGEGGVKQRTALPHERTLSYRVTFSARGTVDSLSVQLRAPSGAALVRARVPLRGDWDEHSVRLKLPRAAGPPYRGSPFGQYVLALVAKGEGRVDLDFARVMSGDAVRGKYNPTTLSYLKEFNVQSLRWPGGNWASAYHWKDGVGPVQDRPIRRNRAWGGLEPNYLGTKEFLEFCELAGVEPLLNVGFNEEIPPEEAANWVEYVNGSVDTEMGALRAQHGHPEPWNVNLWQVGNETYGTYQIGHTHAEDFARRFLKYARAMKAVDPDITVLAAGADPLYRDWNGHAWDSTLFAIAGNRLDGIDIHRYMRGVVDRQNRQKWERDAYLQAALGFSTQFEDILQLLRRMAVSSDISDLLISVGEWNTNPRVNEEWPEMDYPTMAHAATIAGMYNTFIRQGEAVRFTYQRDNTLYYRPYHHDFRPVNPANYTLRLYAEPFERRAAGWHYLPLETKGPTFFAPQAGNRQQDTPDVPYVDAAGMMGKDRQRAVVYLVNRDLNRRQHVKLQLDEEWKFHEAAEGVLQRSTQGPFARQTSWEGPTVFALDELALTPDSRGHVQLSMPPVSVAKLELTLRRDEP